MREQLTFFARYIELISSFYISLLLKTSKKLKRLEQTSRISLSG